MGSEELFKEETSPENTTEEENDGVVEIEDWLMNETIGFKTCNTHLFILL